VADSIETVAFTSMADGTQEDYELLERLEANFAEGTADRVLTQLRELAGSLSGYKIDRLEHSLQSATRAHSDGADEEMVVAALLHDIGGLLSPYNQRDGRCRAQAVRI
jgi:predicted HD phosphohydrolase